MTRSEIFSVVESNIRKIVDEARGKQITEDASMQDLGADSLQVVEIISRSMKELRVKVPRTDLMGARKLKDLVDLFENAQSHPAATP
jgi:polyketide biosynthesis acyl carrier protein